nr:MAG TPA: hypothetical protein [Caudoviricetes sp.]
MAYTLVPPGSTGLPESILGLLGETDGSNRSLLYIATATGQNGSHE